MVTADHNPRLGRGHNDTPAAPRVRWGDGVWIGISKILTRSVNGRCQRLACYVPTVWGQAANKTFSQALILMHTVFLLHLLIRVIDAGMRII